MDIEAERHGGITQLINTLSGITSTCEADFIHSLAKGANVADDIHVPLLGLLCHADGTFSSSVTKILILRDCSH